MATDPMWCYEEYVEAAEYIDMIEEQRDELLAALKAMRNKYGEYACEVCDQADCAIDAAMKEMK